MPTLYLLRHGETEWNRTGRIQGWAYTRLNDTGRQQAAAAAAYLAAETPPIGAVYSSDLPRAEETLTILTDHPAFADCPVTTERAFRERDFGVYQGFESATFFEDHPEYSVLFSGTAGREATPEGGESYGDFIERVTTAYEDLRAELVANDRTAVLITHGGVIERILGHIRDLDDKTLIEEVTVANCSVTKVQLTAETTTVEYQGRTSFLD